MQARMLLIRVIIVVALGSALAAAVGADLAPIDGGAVPAARMEGKKLIRWAAELTNKTRASEVPGKVKSWQEAGYDGLCFSIVSNRSEADALHAGMFFRWWTLEERTREEFAPEIEAFKSVQDWGRLTDNFLLTAVRPLGGRCPDWFRDEDFEVVCSNARLAASIARDIGFKGIVLDTEQYGFAAKGQWRYPWSYAAYRSAYYARCGHDRPLPFADVAAQVRERGRQYAQALSEAFPDIALLVYPGWYESAWYDAAYLLHESEWTSSHSAKPLSLEDHRGLFPAFIDGLLLGLSEDALIVCLSSASYEMSEYGEMAAQKDIAKRALVLSTVPEIASRRLSFAPGLWTDAQADKGGFSNTDPKANRRDPERHEHATANALAVADRYVWHYGETSYFLQWGEGYPFQPDFDKRYEAPPPLIRRYWQANERAHEPHGLLSLPESVYDMRDYAEFDAGAALRDRQSWQKQQEEGYRIVVTLPERWRIFYGGDVLRRRDDSDRAVRLPPDTRLWISSKKCWQSQGIRSSGPVFYAVEFELPGDLDVTSQHVFLALPTCVEQAEQSARIYLNDMSIGNLPDSTVIDVTKTIKPGEKNMLVLGFMNTSGPGGLAGDVRILTRKKDGQEKGS